MWEGDVPVRCSGATIGIMLCPQTLSLSRALLLGSTGEEDSKSCPWLLPLTLGCLASRKEGRAMP